MTARLSAVIPTRNRADILEQNLTKTTEIGVDQIVIVDDASDDTTPILVSKFREHGRGIVYERTQQQIGSASARNLGLGEVDGDIVIMLDDDRILKDKSCLDAVKEDFDRFPPVGIIGGPVFFRKHGWDPEFYTKNAEVLTKSTGFVFVNNFHLSKTLVSFVSCPFAMRREIADSIRYDAELQGSGHTGYREESDFQLTAREKGWKILFDPQFCSYHYSRDRGGNRGQVMAERMYWKARNHALFVRKHNRGLKRWYYLAAGLGVLALYQPRYARETSRSYISAISSDSKWKDKTA